MELRSHDDRLLAILLDHLNEITIRVLVSKVTGVGQQAVCSLLVERTPSLLVAEGSETVLGLRQMSLGWLEIVPADFD